jgi:hypothetical protein
LILDDGVTVMAAKLCPDQAVPPTSASRLLAEAASGRIRPVSVIGDGRDERLDRDPKRILCREISNMRFGFKGTRDSLEHS